MDRRDYQRLIGRPYSLYEIEPDSAKPGKGTTETPPIDHGQRTQGVSNRSRKDSIATSGKTLQKQIERMAAELRKKYGLPRDTGEKPPPPPPTEEPA